MLNDQNLNVVSLLVHIKLPSTFYDSAASIQEFQELTASSNIPIADLVSCRLDPGNIDAKYLIGKGKLSEITGLVLQHKVNLVIFNYELSASQQKNLELFLKCKVLDRTELILYIFAKRARTFEGKLQVELARLKHLSTRLVRVWTHLERQRGGIGLRAGPGEKQIEIDRRLIRQKIKTISNNLEKIRKQRKQNRMARKKAMLPTISLIGYTNSGKSTLFNTLTGAKVTALDLPFVTLDPTLRTVFIPKVGKVILADTVGFIRDLPHTLIEAFKATLEEINASDLLVHVIDLSEFGYITRRRQVMEVLEQIGALEVPILEVYNKIDQSQEIVDPLLKPSYSSNIKISALHKIGIEDLITAISNKLCAEIISCRIIVSPNEARLRAELLSLGAVQQEIVDEYTGEVTLEIVLQKQRWQILCSKFKDIKSYGVE